MIEWYAVGFISGIITTLVLSTVYDYFLNVSPKNKQALKD